MKTRYAETSAFVSRAKPQRNKIVCPRCDKSGIRAFRRLICEPCYDIEHKTRCKERRVRTKLLCPEKLKRSSKRGRMAKVDFSQLSQDYLMRKL